LTHPTVPALASALAVGESLSASGAQFLEAFLTGFEVECKIAEAIDPDHYRRGFHTSGTVGAFGAAASAAKLLCPDRSAVSRTLGIVASFAAGIRVNFGTMTKPLHVGRAAQNGVNAAQLASRGFTADEHALDGPWGFFQVLGGGAAPEVIIGQVGNPHSILDPGVSVKPYPCGVVGHLSMDALLELVVGHDLKPEEIKSVKLRAGSNILEPLRYRRARTRLQAKFCVPFMLASIILRRRAGIKEFTDEFVSSPPVQQMMEKIETVLDPEIESQGFRNIRSIVEVILHDGRLLSQSSAEEYRGGPGRPFSEAELRGKFTECAGLVLSGGRIREAIELIESVERLNYVRQLTAVMGRA
jgi:2-methylcitrate dehydratase PrpD